MDPGAGQVSGKKIMKISEWFKQQGFESYDREGIKEFNTDTSHYSIEEFDLIVIWEYIGKKVKTFRFKILNEELIEKNIIDNDDRYQFLIIKNKNINESKVLRRGTVQSYCKKILDANALYKIKQDMIDISGMKHYITLDEFISWIAKIKLTGLDFSDQKFWSAFKFPHR